MSTTLALRVDMSAPRRSSPGLARGVRAAFALIVGCVLLGGCAIEPPVVGASLTPLSCDLKPITMVPRDDAHPEAVANSEVVKGIRAAMLTDDPNAAGMLVLSGGSEHGAYGAGFLDEWAKDKGGRLPDFRVVTGVSTGALQASAAFVGDTYSLLVGGYEIDQESDLLIPYSGVKGGPKRNTLNFARALIGHGALANLAPARARQLKILYGPVRPGGDMTMLDAVARKAATGAKLYVGLVDMDSGAAVAIDMSALALRWRDATAPQDKTRLAECYADTVIASSSAPMAAPPVFIDGHMYVDGGLRFGLFADEAAEAMTARGPDGGALPMLEGGPKTYAIVNAQLASPPRCDSDCFRNGRHVAWSFDQVALASEEILANQIYRLSKERLEARLGATTTQIPADAAMDGYPEFNGRHCAFWRAQDDADVHPVQFHPRYMRCVIGVGREDYRRRKADPSRPWQ